MPRKFKEKIKKSLISSAANLMLKTAVHSPDKAILGAVYLMQKIATNPNHTAALARASQMIKQKHPGIAWARRLLKELTPLSRKKLLVNLGIETLISTQPRRDEYRTKYGINPPWLIVISPTMHCNLRCLGCYAGQYAKEDNLPYETVDRILNEVKEMGVRGITVSGGEPFINPWILDIFKKHSDCYFLVYTNGTLIGKKLAKKISQLGNVAPAISIEGGRTETDFRRGKGVYQKVMQAMDNLRQARAMFGFSATMTSKNAEVITRDEFIDRLIAKGCKFGWYFQYVPIGRKPDISLMASAEQRNHLREKVSYWRDTRPIFIGDFWNDGCYVSGCMAGGTKYLHINNKGDIEPCVFAQFAVDNIKQKTIKEALQSDFFKSLRQQQENIDNWYTPCCIIDHPEILRKAVRIGKARPTYEGGKTLISDSKITKHLNAYAKKMAELTRKPWQEWCGNNPACEQCKISKSTKE